MKRFALIVLSLCLLAVAMFQTVGCTSDQVATSEGWLNNINSAVVSPIADQKGTEGLSPYARWLFGNVRTFGYAFIDFIRVLAPNAGEPPPVLTPTSQPTAVNDKPQAIPPPRLLAINR